MKWKWHEWKNANTLTAGPQSTTTNLPLASTRFQLGQGCALDGICVTRRWEWYVIRLRDVIAVSRLCQLQSLSPLSAVEGNCQYERTWIWRRRPGCVSDCAYQVSFNHSAKYMGFNEIVNY